MRQAAAHGVKAVPLLGDVTRAADANAMVAAAATRFGGLDILVNNAGVIVAGPFETVTEAQWDRLMAVNVKGVFLCLQAAVPYLRERGAGAIVNVASISGKTGRAFTAAYAATKFAVIGLTQALAQELGPANIRVNAVCPGLLRTSMWLDVVGPARAASLGVAARAGLRRVRPPHHAARPRADAGGHRRGGRLPLQGRQRHRRGPQRRRRHRDALRPFRGVSEDPPDAPAEAATVRRPSAFGPPPGVEHHGREVGTQRGSETCAGRITLRARRGGGRRGAPRRRGRPARRT